MGETMNEPILVVYESAEKWREGCELSLGRPQVGLVPIPGAPGYLAGDDGAIYSTWTSGGRDGGGRPWSRQPRLMVAQRFVRAGHRRNEYKKINLRIGGRNVGRFVHALVCSAFHGPCPLGRETSHLNGIGSENGPENLAWETPKQNHARQLQHGVLLFGERATNAKLSDAATEEVRRLWAKGGVLQRELAVRFGVSQPTISEIVNRRKRWRAA